MRETCAQALGAVLKYMHPSLVNETLNVLLQMQVLLYCIYLFSIFVVWYICVTALFIKIISFTVYSADKNGKFVMAAFLVLSIS